MVSFVFSSLVASIVLINSQTYELVDTYAGETFFDGFNFTTWNNGCGEPLNQTDATALGLINSTADSVYIGVEHTKVYSDDNEYCRETVQINTKKEYDSGLFVLNATHLPYGCGTWPAWWLMGPNWPYTGEIDIIENINMAQINQNTLHTGPNCDFGWVTVEIQQNLTGGAYFASTNCSFEPGCATIYNDVMCYGEGFDGPNGGGIWTLEWDPEWGIKSWFFRPDEVPQDLADKEPNPDTWGAPSAYYPFGVYCTSDNFKKLSMYFDVYFCGWAADTGGDYPSDWDEECSQYGDSCEDFVKNNPDYFVDAYWDINFVDVYSKYGDSKKIDPKY